MNMKIFKIFTADGRPKDQDLFRISSFTENSFSLRDFYQMDPGVL